jgi:hypothetical protein
VNRLRYDRLKLLRRLIGLVLLTLFAMLNPTSRPVTQAAIDAPVISNPGIAKFRAGAAPCKMHGKYCSGEFIGGM